MNSAADIFKKSFLEGYGSNVDTKSIIVALAITLVIGLYIFLAYRVITRKTFYSKTFNISLVGIALITAGIILTIQSSVVVSLGMVGALSIIRFRTAIKDPMDLMFLFWSISTGIICGAGFAEFAVILALALTLTLVVLDRVPIAKAPMILVINSTNQDAEEEVLKCIEKYAKHFQVKSRNMTSTTLDLTIELRTSEGSKMLKDILAVSGVSSAALLNHDGEVSF